MDALRSHVHPAVERFREEPPFRIGGAAIVPETREITIGGKRERIQPQPLRVLMLLRQHKGHLVTRDQMVEQCWDRRIVGDDVINRSILILRRLAERAGGFEIETIPKAGYRLIEGDPVENGAPVPRRHISLRTIAIGVVAACLIMLAAVVVWQRVGGSRLPVIAIESGDSSAGSRSLSRDLLVKLGTLSNVGSGRWRLVEAGARGASADFVFRATESSAGSPAQAGLMLLNGADGNLLWAREFNFAAARENDLRQHVSLTAGRVLGCMLEARQQGGLRSDLLRLFLNACAASAETSEEDPLKIVGMMRTIIAQRPDFAPAWALLLSWERSIEQVAQSENRGVAEARADLISDINRARDVDPALPEIGLAELELLPPNAYGRSLDLLASIRARNPDDAKVWIENAGLLAAVGRMSESMASARRAVELDPLSPALSGRLVQYLAWGGATQAARRALDQAESLWAGTDSLRDAQFAFHLRYGDPRIAQELMSEMRDVDGRSDAYLLARIDPSPANLEQLAVRIRECERRSDGSSFAYAVQALGEFNQTDEAFRWLHRYPAEKIADASYLLFRPGMAAVRRDPRFMQVAKRIGLVDYWESSGRWPDFCSEPGLSYDCAKEAAKLRA
jgi:DNA-binding winged helix-turn-helix (wHTH) protein/tetratricopeptide (TPR) repeat protein